VTCLEKILAPRDNWLGQVGHYLQVKTKQEIVLLPKTFFCAHCICSKFALSAAGHAKQTIANFVVFDVGSIVYNFPARGRASSSF
jgi:hypothetical protein